MRAYASLALWMGLALVAELSSAAPAELRVAPPAGEGMVLQRDGPVPIAGSAEAGAEVTVSFAGRTVAARADEKGNWRAVLPPLAAGGPGRLVVATGARRLVLDDVWVGDVWLCSGQSNMEWVVADAMDAEREVAQAHDPAIRHLKVARAWAAQPAASASVGPWEPADPAHVGGFTAVGYFFARELRAHTDVPIGLINASWGGSRIEPWMSARALGLDDAALERILAGERDYEQRVLAGVRARIGPLPERDGGLVDGRAVWADPGLDDAAWPRMVLPTRWEDAGFEGMDGVVWFRAAVDLTAAEAGADARLSLGPIDDSDIAWVNGQEIGRTELAWNRSRLYRVPPGVLRAGRNVVAVRVEDTGGGGGIWGEPGQLYLEVGGRPRPLAGAWGFRVGRATVDLDFHKSQVATVLFNAMVHPLQGWPIRGVLWYQGESNASQADALVYRDRFRAMIADWRAGWKAPGLPFLWVQLAAYLAVAAEPQDSAWALLRESQSAALALPGTAQAVAIDVGDADDIHPRNKQEVGRRLALAARRVAYGEELVASGPTYSSHQVRGGRVEVRFGEAGGGLMVRGGPGAALVGFAIAGADRRFVWADAAIVGERVLVWSAQVPQPVAVRYAWADNPSAANLCNREGLPASPFRTDTW